MTKGTLRGTKRRAIKIGGFRARMKTPSGRKIVKNRRNKGRKILTIIQYKK